VEEEAASEEDSTGSVPPSSSSTGGIFVPTNPTPEEESQDPIGDKEDQPLELGASLKSVDSLGLVTIKFNSSLATFNISTLDDSNMDIYIQPAQGRSFVDGTLNLSGWEPKEVISNEVLTLKLNFLSPLEISPLEVQDSLVVHFKEEA